MWFTTLLKKLRWFQNAKKRNSNVCSCLSTCHSHYLCKNNLKRGAQEARYQTRGKQWHHTLSPSSLPTRAQSLDTASLVISEVTQSCPTLCDPMDCSRPGSLVHGIFQARILEWVAVREMQIKATSNGLLHHTHWCGYNIKSDNENVSKDEEKLEPSYTAKRNVKWYYQFGNSLAVPCS